MEKLKDKIEKYINKTGVIRTPAYFIKDLFNDVVKLFDTISNKTQNNSNKIQDINNNLLLNYYLANEDIGLYATYDITNIDSPTIIFTKKFADIIIYNDKIINVENGEYIFDSVGQHVIRYITTTIPTDAFVNIDSLIELHIKDGVKKMNSYSINNCQNLITLEIGKDVTGNYVIKETNNISTLILQQFIAENFLNIGYNQPNESLMNNIKNLILSDSLNDKWDYWRIRKICPQIETLYVGKNITNIVLGVYEEYKMPITLKTVYFNNNKFTRIGEIFSNIIENLYIKDGAHLNYPYFAGANNIYIEGDFTYSKENFEDTILCYNKLYIRKNTHFNLFDSYPNNIELYDYDTKERINKLVDIDLEKVKLNYYNIDTVIVKNGCTKIFGNTYRIGEGFIKNIVFPSWVEEIQYYYQRYPNKYNLNEAYECLIIPSNYKKISRIFARVVYFQGTIEQWLNKVNIDVYIKESTYETKLYCYNELIKDVYIGDSELLKALRNVKLNSITINIEYADSKMFGYNPYSNDNGYIIAEKIILNNIKQLSSAFLLNDNVKEITIDKTIEEFYSDPFTGCTNLHIIIIKSLTAPTGVDNIGMGYNGQSNYTGANTATQGINKLIVPTGATGYDDTRWTNYLLNPDKCNFTIEYSDELAAELNGETTA